MSPVLDVDVHPLLKPDEIFTSLAGGQVFSKLDLSSAYQWMLLEESSRDYLTINTHKALFVYRLGWPQPPPFSAGHGFGLP